MAALHRAPVLLSCLLLAACGVGDSPRSERFDTPVMESMTEGERAWALEVLDLVNAERAQEDAPPLTWDELTSDVAYDHCTDMRVRDFYAHTNPDGDGPCDRMEDRGVQMTYCAGENIARHNDSPQDVVAAWMASPDHRANILADHFTHVGIGVHTGSGGPWWTMDFFVR